MRSPPLARAECIFTIGQLASSSVVGAAQPRTSCGSDSRSSACRRAGSADNSLIASAKLRDRQVHQRRSMLKGQLRDRSLRPSRQHPSFILPPVSQRLEAGGRVPCQEKELGDWPDWCFLPLAGTYAIVSKGKTLQTPNQAHHVGILGTLAAWRVTQEIYRFDPTTFDALCRSLSPGTFLRANRQRIASLCVSHDVFPPWSTG